LRLAGFLCQLSVPDLPSQGGTIMSENPDAKTHARETIDQLPENASWDDVMYELYVREAIDAGLADVAAGRTIPQDQIKVHLRELLRRAS